MQEYAEKGIDSFSLLTLSMTSFLGFFELGRDPASTANKKIYFETADNGNAMLSLNERIL